MRNTPCDGVARLTCGAHCSGLRILVLTSGMQADAKDGIYQ